MIPDVHKDFRLFVVRCEFETVLAEGVQFQDGRATTRHTRAPAHKITLRDNVLHVETDPDWGPGARLVWLDEDDSVVISSDFRRFVVQRDIDETGVSGTGQVVEGVQFDGGRTGFRWCANPERSTGSFDSLEGMMGIHGRDGKTRAVWVD